MNKKYLTSKKQFELFKKEVNRMIDILGLREYEVEIKHEYLDSAKADFEVQSGVLCTIRLSKNWHDCEVSDNAVLISARHEVLHLLLYRLFYLSRTRFLSPDEIDRAEHDIVYRLEKIVWHLN